MSLRDRVVAYYNIHNPTKLNTRDFPDRLIAAYRKEKRLGDLIAEMCAKYGHAESEWTLLHFEGLDETNGSLASTNNSVYEHIHGGANVERLRAPNSKPTLLPAPAVVESARCSDEKAASASIGSAEKLARRCVFQ